MQASIATGKQGSKKKSAGPEMAEAKISSTLHGFCPTKSRISCFSNMHRICLLLCAMLISINLKSEPVDYGYPVKYITLRIEEQTVKMAYLDVRPEQPNGKCVLLLHGKNFSAFYWKHVISALAEQGFRVIAPDQVGWGKSDKPNIHYSFHLLAANTMQLLDTLGIRKISVIGHSMGGMLATRFALMFPETAEKLVLENPIGLEDYKTFVPYQPTDSLYKNELAATYQSYLAYQKTYYPEWKPEYEPLVAAQAAALDEPGFSKTAWANALTYQMIYEQPVCYEFKNLSVPTLLVIGQSDHTIVGKNKLSMEVREAHGRYSQLGAQTHKAIKGSRLIKLYGVGHIPHIQTPETFLKAVIEFLRL
jgi:pimeloyl-ACP methyl ester carboxylesterase